MSLAKGDKAPNERGFTPAEVAWLTELSPKTVNKAIDRGELPGASRKLGLAPPEVLYLSLRRDVC